jgi:hypothetical protein
VADEGSLGDRIHPVDETDSLELLEEFKQLQVSDVLVQTVVGLSSLGYRSLGEEGRDLEQAKLAIEALRALVPVLEGSVSEQATRDFQQLVSNMQLAYATAAREPTA